jgi:hypothetical protein
VNGLHSNAVEPTLEILAMVEHEIDVIDNLVTKSCSDTRVCIKFDSEVLRFRYFELFLTRPISASG